MNGRKVGVLDGSDQRSLRFTYDDAYITDPRSTPLSVSMPLRPGPYLHSTIEPYLWGLLPDNPGVIERWGREFQCSPRSVIALLSNVGIDVAGAAQYVPAGETPEASQPGIVEPLSHSDVGDLLRTVRQDSASWHARSQTGRWSLAGAQAKIALAHDPVTGEWGAPSGRAPTTHILKPAIAQLDDHDLNEHLCLATAHELGLRSAETSVAHFGEERALVVARYDRVAAPDGSIIRVHQEDFCQALSVHPDLKYENDGGPTTEQMVALLDDAISDDSRSQKVRLCEALAYSWLVLGPDAHAKNCSLLLSGGQVRFAPLYDVASVLPYDAYPPKVRLAQKIGGEYRAGFVAARHWERLAKAAAIPYEYLAGRIETMAENLPDAFSTAIEGTDLTKAERARAAGILDSVAAWSGSRLVPLRAEHER
ncbi:MAG TPA: type II toxin-antitoxin system HipA family toxin [Acidimicrobiales bacterium]